MKVKIHLKTPNNEALFDFCTIIPVPWLCLMNMLGWMSIEFFQKGIWLSMRGTIGAVKVCQSYAIVDTTSDKFEWESPSLLSVD